MEKMPHGIGKQSLVRPENRCLKKREQCRREQEGDEEENRSFLLSAVDGRLLYVTQVGTRQPSARSRLRSWGRLRSPRLQTDGSPYVVSHSTCFPTAAVYMVIRSITPSETERGGQKGREGERERERSMSVSQRCEQNKSERGARKAHRVINASEFRSHTEMGGVHLFLWFSLSHA